MKTSIILLLVGYCVIREVIFVVTVQRLINKLMSASFYDYQVAKTVTQKKKEEEKPKEQEIEENLGYLDEFLS